MIIDRIPTANESPDSSQIVGDLAVTSPTNTGHASTQALADVPSETETRTCRWFTFQNLAGGIRTSVKLKVTHTCNGNSSGAPINSNFVKIEYSTDNGSNWTTLFSRLDFNTSEGPTTEEVSLSLTQDLTQVQVRSQVNAAAASSPPVNATLTISNIKIEVTVNDPTLLD